MTGMARRFLVMAGGTGGHVYPGLAVATRLRELGHEVEWMGTSRGLEAHAVPAAGIDLHTIDVRGIRGGGARGWLMAPPRLLAALTQALRIVRQCRPHAVLGMGGFASGPGGVAARLVRRPLVVHEQNAVPGLTNRLLSHIATRVLQAFPDSFSAGPVETTGNPVRAAIARVAPMALDEDEPVHVLVLGGSQGARALNEMVPQAIASLAGRYRIEITHQCGERHVADATAAWAKAGLDVQPVAFIDDMAAAYGRAHLVVCRAGAMTVCEVAAAGRAALFIPFPHAVDDHQMANARYLADAGAAVAVAERSLDVDKLTGHLAALLDDRAGLVVMGRRARERARSDATERVAAVCLEVCND